MTLLQTRVDDQVASRFKMAAKKRNMSPYQLLNELVTKMAEERPPGWEEQQAWLESKNLLPLKQNAVIATREGEDR